jgi:hypothetical protein
MAKDFVYRKRIDANIAFEFAKHNCKKCYGDGLLRYEDVGETKERYDYCDCVKNRIRKYKRM